MKLTTSTAAAVVIAILFIAFGARANSDQDADPVMSVLIEPVAQVLPQEPLAQTPPQPPIEAEPEPSFWGWLWASFKKNHEPIGTLSISIGGFIGIALALWRAIVATEDARTRDRDARTNSANAVTTAYTQAMEQLGWTDTNDDPVLGGRLSGVYALEKIAQNNEEYREQIIKVLTGYVRQHAPVVFYVKKTNSDFDVILQNYEPEIEIDPDNPKHVYAVKYKTRPREDIQAVFDVFSGVKADWVNKTLDPHRGYLNFSSSHLGGILFQPLGITCSFHCSTLMKASLKRSRFGAGTVFIDSNLAYAHFDEAELHGCEWSLTNLDNTYFISAKLSKAEGLIRDQLKTAVLTGDFEWLDEHDNED